MRESHHAIHQVFLIITGVIFAILSSSILFFCLRFHSGGDITWQMYDLIQYGHVCSTAEDYDASGGASP